MGQSTWEVWFKSLKSILELKLGLTLESLLSINPILILKLERYKVRNLKHFLFSSIRLDNIQKRKDRILLKAAAIQLVGLGKEPLRIISKITDNTNIITSKKKKFF